VANVGEFIEIILDIRMFAQHLYYRCDCGLTNSAWPSPACVYRWL